MPDPPYRQGQKKRQKIRKYDSGGSPAHSVTDSPVLVITGSSAFIIVGSPVMKEQIICIHQVQVVLLLIPLGWFAGFI